METNNQLVITPETKLHHLLEAYPLLEDKLIALSPAYAKLKNPVLRRTIGKVATLKQVAEIGKIPIGDFINLLRNEVGVNTPFRPTHDEDNEQADGDIDVSNLTKSLDARPLLQEGIHPLGQVLKEVEQMDATGVYELITPFTPIPLIEKVKAKGFIAQTKETGPNEVRTYFKRSA